MIEKDADGQWWYVDKGNEDRFGPCETKQEAEAIRRGVIDFYRLNAKELEDLG